MIIGNETEQIEFKLTTGEKKEAMESICAILNKHCNGTLYFGVDDEGFVKGQQITDSTKRDVSRMIAESIEPKITPSVETLSIESKEIIKVSFAGHNRPYSVNGKYLCRVGTENRKMTTEELKCLIKNEDYSSHWEEELTKYSINDIDETALLDFFKSAKDSGRLMMDKYDKERILVSLGLLVGKNLNNAGYALFGNNAKIGLKLATFPTSDKVAITDLKLVNGNIYNLINVALNYVLNRINWRVEIGSRKREEIPEIPEKALREIIVNSFAHANYENLSEIEIGIHPNNIEIYNPGSFPDELTPFDFINKNLPSYKRNKLILDVLFRSKDVEKSGTGFQRVNSLCNSQGVAWTYRKEAYGFYFEFIRPSGQLNVQTSEELSTHEQTTLHLINDNKHISKEELAIRLGKSERTVQRIISSLMNKQLIIRIGSNKTGYWEANKGIR